MAENFHATGVFYKDSNPMHVIRKEPPAGGSFYGGVNLKGKHPNQSPRSGFDLERKNNTAGQCAVACGGT
ncbi:MAG: hypothetical protein IJZ91_09225 [Oscillospiraceae bacterium]|nr:hypothetical protein [Oscillospiraceae bacterium]